MSALKPPFFMPDLLLSDIHVASDSERRNLGDLLGLTSSIRNLGLVEPIVVSPCPEEGKFQVISGSRRCQAAKDAGLKEVPAVIQQPKNRWEERVRRLVANLQRQDLHPIEVAEAVKALLDDYPKVHGAQKALGQLLGKDDAWVSEALRILDLPEKLRTKVSTSGRRVSGESLARIARVDDTAQQERLIDELINGATVKSVRQQIATVREGGSRPATARKPPKSFSSDDGFHVRKFFVVGEITVVVQSQKAMTKAAMVRALKSVLEKLKG